MKTMQEAIQARVEIRQEKYRKLHKESNRLRLELRTKRERAAQDFKEWIASEYDAVFTELDVKVSGRDDKSFWIKIAVGDGCYIELRPPFYSGENITPSRAGFSIPEIWRSSRRGRSGNVIRDHENFLDALIHAMGIDWKHNPCEGCGNNGSSAYVGWENDLCQRVCGKQPLIEVN